MSDELHDRVAELLGVYALDAVDDDERRLVDDHLPSCPRCRAELRDHTEVAAALGDFGAAAPPGVWDSIAARLDDEDDDSVVVPPLDLASIRAERESATAPPVAPRSRPGGARILAAAAAVVLVAAFGAMGWIIADQQGRLDEMETAMEGDSMMLDPDAELVALDDAAGATYATVVMGADGRAVLIGSGLAPLPEGRIYQLWAVGPDGPVSLGMLGSDPQLVSVGMVDGESMTLAITEEPSGGSPAPTSDPMATGETADL